ncbi:MAG: phosphate regulon sensor histidine kinase PhoR [Granulosicoccus sp.]
MFSTNLKTELTWFFWGWVLALMVGLIINWPAITLLLYVCGYVAWLLYRMETIVGWLRTGAKAGRAPYSYGLTDEMVQLIHREKKYSRKQKNRFRRSLSQFNTLAANLPDAIIVLDNDYEIRWSNPAARTLLNIHPEKDRGQRIDNLIRNPVFSEFLDEKNENVEAEIQGPTAADRVLTVRKVPNKNHMTVLIAADITQRAKVREMRKAFVGDVSHELRTPLTVIRGYLEMLQEHENLDPPVREALKEVSTQSDRMRGIVDALLELSKLESNPLGEHEGEPVNIAAMVHAMIVPLKNEAPEHRFQLHLDESLVIIGSEQELYSACNNLLTNAIKYTSAGTTITVTWAIDRKGTAQYSVADNGAGIEPRHLSRLSERFYRVDTGRSREQGGTGLGLAIVKHAVQRHGGRLEIRSTPGSGSQFTALFPDSRVQVVQQVANQ